MHAQEKRTELNELGEFGLIHHLTAGLKTSQPSTLKGVGDDAAAIRYPHPAITLISTDMLLEGVHFDLMYTPLTHLGYKAVVANLSDIYAMNGVPRQITVNLGISSKFSVEAVEEVYAGIIRAAQAYGVDIVGGDTTGSKTGLVLSITVLGEVAEEKVVYRNTAREKDILMVTGDLGGAFMGLQILEREKSVFRDNPGVQPDLEGYDYILERQLKPEARKDMISLFAAMDLKPTSMIDISDGLASEILHLCKGSKLGCRLMEDSIPMDPTTVNAAQDFNLDPIVCALNGGEDYELLFTISPSDFDKVKGNPNLTPIGYMTDPSEGVNLVARDGSMHPLTAQGWDAFLNKQLDGSSANELQS